MGAKADAFDATFAQTTLTQVLGPALPEGARWHRISVKNCGAEDLSISFSENDNEQMVVPSTGSENLTIEDGFFAVWMKFKLAASAQVIINVG